MKVDDYTMYEVEITVTKKFTIDFKLLVCHYKIS